MILRDIYSDRRNSAQIQGIGCRHLAKSRQYATVQVVGCVSIPALPAYHLFRTPSLNGQVVIFDVSLPVSFLRASRTGIRRGIADSYLPTGFLLRQVLPGGHESAQAKKKRKGWAGCEQNILRLPVHFARRCQLAETPQASRRFTEQVQDSSAQQFLTEMYTPARRQERRPTSSIASKIRAGAADSGCSDRTAAKPSTPRLDFETRKAGNNSWARQRLLSSPEGRRVRPATMKRSFSIRFFRATTRYTGTTIHRAGSSLTKHNARFDVAGRMIRDAVLRSTSTQTKDTKCSTRS